jgi:hypothetical protein
MLCGAGVLARVVQPVPAVSTTMLPVAYEGHPRCDTPADNTVVWRYMSFVRLMSLLESASLWLSRIDLLDDSREGRLTDLERSQIREHQGENAEEFVRNLERQRHTTFVNCWQENDRESMAMWDLYGRELGSVAVKSTIGRVKEALVGEGRSISIGRIGYLDWTQGSWPNNVLGMAVRKAQGYKHESEVRLVTWAWDLWRWDFGRTGPPRIFHQGQIENAIVEVLKEQSIFSDSLDQDMRRAAPIALNKWMQELQVAQLPHGISAAVNLAPLVEEVVLGPKEPEWIFGLVKGVLERYKLTATARLSELRHVDDTY